MINWLNQEEGYCEGIFESMFFKDDEGESQLSIMAKSPDLVESAKKCVEAFNHLSESEIRKICELIVNHIKESGLDEEVDLSSLEDENDILNYCWFTTMYVNMLSNQDEIEYVIEGEGDWGDVIGFVVRNDKVIYVGVNYFDYMKEE